MLLSRQSIISFFAFCLSILGIGFIQFTEMQKILHTKKNVSLASLEQNIKLEALRLKSLQEIPSFSYDNLIADWIYIDFLQYYGDDEIRDITGYALSPEYFEVILKRDPRFLEAYLSLSTSTSLYAAMPERSIALMNQGLKSLTPAIPEKSYYVWRYKGSDELLFLGDAKSAQKSFAQAANWASTLPDEESKNLALFSQKTSEFLGRNPNSKYARISTWALILNYKVDDKTRQRAIKEIEALGGTVVKTSQGMSIKFPDKD